MSHLSALFVLRICFWHLSGVQILFGGLPAQSSVLPGRGMRTKTAAGHPKDLSRATTGNSRLHRLPAAARQFVQWLLQPEAIRSLRYLCSFNYKIATMSSLLERYFSPFRSAIIGQEQHFETPFGRQRILYADWTASGRAYRPIEERILTDILPFYGNTHTETTVTGTRMSAAYAEAKAIVKAHVHADEDDVLLFCGSGMTSAINKLQRLLGLRIPERASDYRAIPGLDDGTHPVTRPEPDDPLHPVATPRPDDAARPLVLLTHMEHHSNYVSWLETVATVEMMRPGAD